MQRNPLMEMEGTYRDLRDEFFSIAQFYINQNILSILKEYYAANINSNRKLSQIKDLRTLLKVLEKRDVLNCGNVEPLLYISNNFLNDMQIQNKIKNYNSNLQNMQNSLPCNVYQESNEGNKNEDERELQNIIESNTSEASNESENQPVLQKQDLNSNCPTQETRLQQRLLSHICERIGRSWRDTIRYLGVPEYQIDIIQNKHPFDLKEQSYEALKLYISQYSNSNWRINLIHALEKARRRDLKEFVEKLILESNN